LLNSQKLFGSFFQKRTASFLFVPSISPWLLFLSRVASVITSLLLGGLAFSLCGYNAPKLAADVVSASLGDLFGLEDLCLIWSPLILTGLAAAVALRIGLWNIGGEGQFYAGQRGAGGDGIGWVCGWCSMDIGAGAGAGVSGSG
jgi:simple sugar transport system permease protein